MSSSENRWRPPCGHTRPIAASIGAGAASRLRRRRARACVPCRGTVGQHDGDLSADGERVSPRSERWSRRLRLDLFRSDLGLLQSFDWTNIDRNIRRDGRGGAIAALLKAGCRKDEIRISVSGDLRYKGQHNELTIQLPTDVMRRAISPRSVRLRRRIRDRLRYQVDGLEPRSRGMACYRFWPPLQSG